MSYFNHCPAHTHRYGGMNQGSKPAFLHIHKWQKGYFALFSKKELNVRNLVIES